MNLEKGEPQGGVDFDFDADAENNDTPEVSKDQEILVRMATDEQDELPPTAKDRPKMSRARNVLRLMTVGLVLAMSTPDVASAQKLNPEEQIKIERQMYELQEQLDASRKAEKEEKKEQRKNELDSWIKPFEVEGLNISTPKGPHPRLQESVGIYIKGKGKKPELFLGNITAGGRQHTLTESEVANGVGKLLNENEIKNSGYEYSEGIKMETGDGVNDILEEWGGEIVGETLNYGNPADIIKLNADGQTDSVSVIVDTLKIEGESVLFLKGQDKDGRVFSCGISKKGIFNFKY